MAQDMSAMSEDRPWGFYQVLDQGAGYKVKRISVSPGARLSLQRHKHRSEHWVVVTGKATVTVDNEVADVPLGGKVDIPLGAKHRLANNTEHLVEIIEIQFGSYLEEDDIERFDDIYGRT